MRFLVGLTVCALGCSGRTEIVVGVATDLVAKNQIDRAQLVASRNGAPLVMQDWPLTDVPAGMYELPGSFGLYSPDGSEPRIELSVTGYLGDRAVADREAVLSLVSGQTLFLRMTITSVCDPDSGPKCADDESCVEGSCQRRLIEAHRLPKFRDQLVKNTECDGAVKYKISSTGMPMGTIGSACESGAECHEGTCWTPPPGSTGGPNCLALDLGFPDGGESVVVSTDMRLQNLPVEVGSLFCGQHFYPPELTLNAGDSLQYTAVDGMSHHLMSTFITPTTDVLTTQVSITFTDPGDFPVTCVDHPNAGLQLVHVVN